MKFKTPAVAIAAFITGAIAIPGVVAAQSDGEGEAPEVPVTAPEPERSPANGIVFGFGPIDIDNLTDIDEGLEGVMELESLHGFTPSAEEVDQMNADTDAIVDALKAAGIEVTTETDEHGLTYPVFPENLAEAQWDQAMDVMDQVLTERHGELGGVSVDAFELEDLDDFEDFEPTPEELAEWNAETEALIEELEAAGVPVERDEVDGFLDFIIPEELTAAQEEALDEIFGNCVIEGEFGDEAGHTDTSEATDGRVDGATASA